MPGMLSKRAGVISPAENGPLPTVTPEQVKAAIELLKAKGVPLTRTNIAEAAAMIGRGAALAPRAPSAPGGLGQRLAAPGTAGGRAEAALELKRKMGPPAEMLRNRGMLSPRR